ncbi:MAG: glycosyltransferase family 4 protein [Acidobacteriota bacterium]|nr:glycosyltransferase family 4 protein [Blastocatellia bacterium]MDW8238442.1 glycosyltransferase family 4 protein [Acidobacteriota bacterium]
MNVVMIASGALEYTVELANAMSDHHRVNLLVPRHEFAHLEWALDRRVNLHALWWPRQRDPRSALFLLDTHQLIERLNPDVVHILSCQTWLNGLMPLLSHCALVATTHDVVPHVGDSASRKIPVALSSYSLRRAHRVIVHGEKLKADLIRLYHLPADRIDIIPHGVLSLYCRLLPGTNSNDPASLPADDLAAAQPPTILFFGRIYKYKGLDYLIDAQPHITRAVPEARIVIAGRGDDMNQYIARFRQPDRFDVYNQFIANEQVAELFQRATVVVLPYIDGSQSGVLQIAYAFGKPVVATRVGSIQEAVDDGRTGLLVPPCDARALADAIIELLRDPARRALMREQIGRQVATRFAWSTIALATTETYQRAQQERRRLTATSCAVTER